MDDHLVVAFCPAEPLEVVVMEAFRFLLEGLGIVSQGDQLAALHDLKGDVGILGQGPVAPAPDPLDKLTLDDEVRAGDPTDLEEVPDRAVLDPLGDDDLLINTPGKEVLLGVAGLVTAKNGHVAFWVRQRLVDEKVEGVGLRHGVRIIDADVFAMCHLEGVV